MDLREEVFQKNICIYLQSVTHKAYFRYLLRVIDFSCANQANVTLINCNWQTEYMKHDNHVFVSATKMREEMISALTTKHKEYFRVTDISEGEVFPEIPMDNVANLANSLSVSSILMTLGYDQSNLDSKTERLRAEMNRDFNKFYNLAAKYSSKSDLTIFLNGRWPEQAAIRAYCQRLNKKFLSLEHGKPNGERFHLQSFQTQEYPRMRSYFESIIAQLNQAELDHALSWGKEWLEIQSTSLKANPFLMASSKKRIRDEQTTRVASIFNSSFDERFSNLGIELNGWEDQEIALASVVEDLSELGFKPVVRIHPNTINKGWNELTSLFNFLRKNNVEIVLPWNSPSTYELLEISDVVITWGSTVSLESTARGIPTINLGRTSYDSIIDVALLSSSGSFKEIDLTAMKPDPNKSLIAAYLTRNWGFKLINFSLDEKLESLDDAMNKSDFWLSDKKTSRSKSEYLIKKLLEQLNILDFVQGLRMRNNSTYGLSPSDLYRLLKIFREERIRNLLMTKIFNVYAGIQRLK